MKIKLSFILLFVLASCVQLVEPDFDDLDRDGDSFLDVLDAFPDNSAEWVDTDLDGQGNNSDTDDDGDGCNDDVDAFPLNPLECLDTDNDSVGNNEDKDDDGDGTPDVDDPDPLDPLVGVDTDSDGVADALDEDDDGDGILDVDDAFPLDSTEALDTDSDGIGNNTDSDDDGDGDPDSTDPKPLDATSFTDTDNDGISDNRDNDSDGDGCLDTDDDHPLNPNLCFDNDKDGVANANDAFPNDATETTDADSDSFGSNSDCDDSDATVNTNRLEVCANSKDDDCDSSTDELECLISITGGTFNMGADADGDGEGSLTSQVHDVTLSTFYIDKYEITNSQYQACVTAGSCTVPSALNPVYGNSTYADWPIFYVSWEQANAYCSWVGKRLPTEAEWEYAARNGRRGQGSETTYPWGNGAIDTTLANYFSGGAVGTPTDVDEYAAGDNDDAVYNLSGNVAEWVSDFAGNYPLTADATVTNPTGPATGQTTNKILRGGSYSTASGLLEGKDRFEASPTTQSATTGFRCASSDLTKS